MGRGGRLEAETQPDLCEILASPDLISERASVSWGRGRGHSSAMLGREGG